MTNDQRMSDEAEKWYYDLGQLAQRVDSNYQRAVVALERADRAQHRAEVSRRRLYVLALFTLFAFFLLAYRTEVQQHRSDTNRARIEQNTDRVDVNTKKIVDNAVESCKGGLAILTKFNTLQEELAQVERMNLALDPKIRNARIAAYENARILPLPKCGADGSRR